MRIRSFIAAAAIALMGVLPTQAQVQTFFKHGFWETYGGIASDGLPMCGIKNSSDDGSQSFHIKYFAGDEFLVVQIYKTSWDIPTGLAIPLQITIDNNGSWDSPSTSIRAGGTLSGLETYLPIDSVNRFFQQFEAGSQFTVDFLQGNETRWIGSLKGSKAASMKLMECIIAIGDSAPTQPYTPAPTQPFSAPTQPFAPNVPASPSTGTPPLVNKMPTYGV